MNTDIHTELKDHSRIWIYQADRQLSDNHIAIIEEQGKKFTDGWNAHGNSLFADLQVFHGFFVILAVDEQIAMASGCSIDKSVHFIQMMEKELNISLTNRLNIALKKDEDIQLIPLTDLEDSLKDNTIAPDQLFFDNTITSLGQLRNEWIKPLKSSWLQKFMPENTVF